MKIEKMREKSETALRSARRLLDAGDTDGATNRAYYAAFDMARVALMKIEVPVREEVAKTHSGLIAIFSLHLIKTGKLPVELGRFLNFAHQVRLIADYQGDSVEPEKAAKVVEGATHFVETITKTLL